MGKVATISRTGWPKQGYLHKRVVVCFHHDTSQQLGGRIVRDDIEPPNLTVIALDDGRFVLATECHYALVADVIR